MEPKILLNSVNNINNRISLKLRRAEYKNSGLLREILIQNVSPHKNV